MQRARHGSTPLPAGAPRGRHPRARAPWAPPAGVALAGALLALAGGALGPGLARARAQDGPTNPLARRAPAWAGAFAGEGVRVTLRAGAPGAFAGEVAVGDARYPAQGTVADGRLTGAFEADGARFTFTAALDGPDTLVLVSDGVTHRLARVGPPRPANPLAPGREGPGGPAGADPLAPRDERPGTAWRHPAGWVAFELAPGWRVGEVTDELVLVAAATPDVAVLVHGGELDAGDRGKAPGALLRESGPDVLVALGVEVQGGLVDLGALRAGGHPGHAGRWRGARNGAPVEAWVAAVVVGEHVCVVVGLAEAGRLDGHLPGVRRLVASLRLVAPTAEPGGDGPAPGAGGPGGIAGHEFSHVETTPAGSFFARYAFQPGGRVQRTLSMAGGVTEAWGRWREDGARVVVTIEGEEEALEVLRDGAGAVTALRRPGGRTYRRR